MHETSIRLYTKIQVKLKHQNMKHQNMEHETSGLKKDRETSNMQHETRSIETHATFRRACPWGRTADKLEWGVLPCRLGRRHLRVARGGEHDRHGSAAGACDRPWGARPCSLLLHCRGTGNQEEVVGAPPLSIIAAISHSSCVAWNRVAGSTRGVA